MQQNNNTARRASIILGLFMAGVLVLGALLPLFTDNTAAPLPVDQPRATTAPPPTFPAPPSDLSRIRFDRQYLHPSGIFAIGLPEGWTATESQKGAAVAQAALTNNSLFAVVDTYVQDAGEGAALTVADLDGRFTRDAIDQSWSRFNRWEETRRVSVGDRLEIDFNVFIGRQNYIAAQRARTDGRWIYVVRVVVPENAAALLDYLLDGFDSSFAPLTVFRETPLSWSAYYDPADHHVIRFPSEWSLVNAAPGRPASITSANGVALRVEHLDDAIVDTEESARTVAGRLRAGIRIASVARVERDGALGYSVTYERTTIDGEPVSGALLLLNSETGLHVADLSFPAEAIDLNTVSLTPAVPQAPVGTPLPGLLGVEAIANSPQGVYRDLALVLSTFRVIPPLQLDAPVTDAAIDPLLITPDAPTSNLPGAPDVP